MTGLYKHAYSPRDFSFALDKKFPCNFVLLGSDKRFKI